MEETRAGGGLLATLSYFFAWIIASAGAIIDALAIREAVLAILAWYKVISTVAYHRKGGIGEDLLTTFGVAAVDNAMLFLLGVVAVGLIIWIEYYFRKGRPKGLLYRRIAKVLGIEVAIILFALLIRQFIAGII